MFLSIVICMWLCPAVGNVHSGVFFAIVLVIFRFAGSRALPAFGVKIKLLLLYAMPVGRGMFNVSFV